MNPSPSNDSPASRSFARWSVSLLIAINLFNYIDRQVVAGLTLQIKEEFSASDEQIGWLMPACLVSYMLTAPIFGWLSDRYRRWLIVSIGVVLWSVASGLSGLAGSIGVLLFTRMFVGIGEAAYAPTAPTIISDLYSVEKRGRMMSLFYAAIPVGSALGYLLGGVVLGRGLSWHWAFFIVVPPGILMGFIAFKMRDPERTIKDGKHKATRREFFDLLKIPSFIINTIGMAAMTFALGGIAYWMPKYIVWKQHTDMTDRVAVDLATADANAVFGPIIVVSGLLATLVGGWLGDKLRKKFSGAYFLVSGISALAGFPLVWAITVTPFPEHWYQPGAWYLIFAACCCLFFNTGPTNTILANVTKPTIRAAAFAMNIFLIHVFGDAISPPLIGKINDLNNGDMNPGIRIVSCSVLISGIVWLVGCRYLKHDTDAAERQTLQG